MLYAIGGPQGLVRRVGPRGAAYIDADGGLSWRTDPARPHDLYVRVTDQPALDQRIDALIAAK